MMQRLASRSFTTDDQARFAGLTGDFNPAHMDPIVARRLQAGAPIVHGMHTLLWCLDVLAAHRPDLPAVATFKVRFDKLVYLGDVVEALLMRHDARGFHLEAQVQGAVALRCAATFGEPRAASASEPHRQSLLRPTQPIDLSIEQMAGRSGRVAFATPSAELGRIFPAAARQWGDRRVASLGCMTYLVGMVCPGLHSIFGGMSLDVVDVAQTDDADTVSFCVGTVDPRFRVVRLKVSANGLGGSLETFARPPPIEQAGIAQLAHLVRPGEFADTHALVIGGSRGLGEVTAKLLAAGGANVTLTYATGSVDAERIRDDIEAWGAPCRILQYDVRRPPAGQLEWGHVPNSQLYYFATPPIFRQSQKLYSRDRLALFLDYYVDAFSALCEYMTESSSGQFAAFYPSSVFVDDRPPGMTEYTMAKVAAEVLCHDMNARSSGIHVLVHRVPRVRTDQTSSIMQATLANTEDVMLPLIRQMQLAPIGS